MVVGQGIRRSEMVGERRDGERWQADESVLRLVRDGPAGGYDGELQGRCVFDVRGLSKNAKSLWTPGMKDGKKLIPRLPLLNATTAQAPVLEKVPFINTHTLLDSPASFLCGGRR